MTDPTITCPSCGHVGPDGDFDCGGLDEGWLFCNRCDFEFNAVPQMTALLEKEIERPC